MPTRREVIAALGGFFAGGITATVGISSLGNKASPASLNNSVPEIEVDPFWTQNIYMDTSVSLRPTNQATEPRAKTIVPNLVESAWAQENASGVALYYFDDKSQTFAPPTRVTPEFDKGSVSIVTHLLAAHVSPEVRRNADDHATFKFDLGDAFKDDSNYGVLLTGMNIFKNPNFGVSINEQVLGGRPPVIIKDGDARVTFNFWRHKPKSWCSKILGFVKNGADIWKSATKALTPLLVIPQVETPVLQFINNAIGLAEGVDKKNQDGYDYIWPKDSQKKLAITKEAKENMGWDLSLKSGYWILTDQNGASHLAQDSDLTLQTDQRYFLAHKQEPHKPVLDDVNYIVFKFVMRAAASIT